MQLSKSDRIIEQLKIDVKRAASQSQDVTAYEDMIRRLETELNSAEEQRKQTLMEFNNLKASMTNNDSAAKDQLDYLSAKVCLNPLPNLAFISPKRPITKDVGAKGGMFGESG